MDNKPNNDEIKDIMSKPVNTQKQDTIKHYFNQIANHKLLSKEDQIDLGFKIEKNNLKILQKCIKSTIFIIHLNKLISKMLNSNDKLFKSCRLVDENSTLEELKLIHQKLIACQSNPNLIIEIGLTSSAISSLLNPLKSLALNIRSIESIKKQTYKFLEIDNDDDYKLIIKKCKDPIERRKLARYLYTTENTLINYLLNDRKWIELYKKEKIKPEDIQGIKDLYDDVSKLNELVTESRDLLITSNLKLVVNRAKKFKNSGVQLEELIQEGNIGLIRAVDKFEPSKDIKVSTYATWWIDQAIQRGIANKKDLVRIPIHIQFQIKKINEAFVKLSQANGNPPNFSDIANFTGMTLDRVTELQSCALHEVGIDHKIGDDMSYLDVLVDKHSISPSVKVDKLILNEKIRRVLSTLEPRLQKIIMARFGIGWAGKDHTLLEIANQHGLSKQRIRNILSESSGKLRKHKLFDGIE